MPGINSRSKGARNERKAADLVSKWTGRKFAKTPASGGLHWKKSFVQGDIVCTKEGHYCPFCFEVKAHKEINFAELLTPAKKGIKVLEFWEQASRDGAECKKVPILMMRYNGMPSDLFFIAMPRGFHKMICRELGVGHYFQYVGLPTQMITIMPSQMLMGANYKTIKKIAKKYLTELYGKS